MYTKKLEAYKKTLKLSSVQREILVGTLLGNGCLETKNGGKTYRLRIEHSIAQRAYVDWLYEHFRAWVQTKPRARDRLVVFRGKEKKYTRYGFSTISSSSLRFFAQQFYQNKKKSVPKLIHRWVTPLAVAVWYMDDGSIQSNEHRTVLFNTHGFSDADLARLQKVLQNRFEIQTRVRTQKDEKQLYVLSKTIDQLANMISPHIIESMKYKLPKTWLTQLPKK